MNILTQDMNSSESCLDVDSYVTPQTNMFK